MHINYLSKDIHIKDYLFTLQRRKWIVISFFLIILTTVTIATFLQKKIYRATATVIVDAESPDILSVKDVIKLGETNYFAYRDYIETQQEIIRSRRTAHYVIKNLNLMDNEEIKKAKDPIEALLKKLDVELVRDTRIVKIQVDDGDPRLASLIANEFAKVYAESNISLKMKMSSQAQSWLKDEVEEQKQKLAKSELKLQDYKEKNSIVNITSQEKTISDSLANLNIGYLDAQKKRIKAGTTYRSLLDEDGNVTLENLPALLTDNATIQLLKEDYLKQEALLVEYKEVYKHKHPKMIRLLDNIGHVKSRIKHEIETEYKTALEEERKFKDALDIQKKKALGLERKIINYNVLKREVETNERMLQIVLNRLKETSVSSQILTNNVRVQDLAEPPKKPIKPKKTLNIALAMIIGLTGGIGLAFFREYMDTTVKDPDEIAVSLEIPVLGSVPKVRLDANNIKEDSDIDRIVEKDSQSLAAEAYRTIRTNLLFSLNHSASAKSIVITSSVPKEGKTITAVNLAMMISSGGERVLLVDADMRKPRIHTIFNETNENGLSQFLSGERDFENVVKSTTIDNLYLVTSGEISHKPAELISSNNMKVFLEKASSQFSKIIIDTPPIALVTDAAILASMTSGVLLIAEGGRVTKALLAKSKELLQKVDAKILGVIVNNISLTKDLYSYPQYYYGKYYKPAKTK